MVLLYSLPALVVATAATCRLGRHTIPDLPVGQTELHQCLAGACLLQQAEVLPRHVLDQRHFERCRIVVLADQRGDLLQARNLSREPASLSRDELVPSARTRAHQHRLQNAPLADRVGQRVERRLVEVLPGL